MPAKLASGAIRHMEGQILEAAEEVLTDQQLQVNATQHAPGDRGIGVESVIIEITADVGDSDLQEELLDYAFDRFVGAADNLVFQAVQHSHDRLRSYGSNHQYHIESIIGSFAGVEATQSANGITIGYGWEHPAAAYFERGTSDHRVNGNPVLSFVWQDPPTWVREAFDQARSSGGEFASGWRVFLQNVDVAGIPESRFVRHGIRWLESEVAA